jgi:hypothetical protein
MRGGFYIGANWTLLFRHGFSREVDFYTITPTLLPSPSILIAFRRMRGPNIVVPAPQSFGEDVRPKFRLMA